jgi:serine/threonine-protein kinase
MGEVFEARHEMIGKRLAVKLLRPEFVQRTDVVTRFTREAEAAAAIGHPSIIDIHDLGTADDGSVFLVMEYLEGLSLGEMLERTRPLDPAFTAYVVCQLLSALDAAHAKEIVHRDLKPDNVFLVDKGQALPEIKLLDFGISKIVDHTSPDFRLTQTGAVMGTPYYMAPEQARGSSDIDRRADIYAVGVILYECLTGRRPFEEENYLALVNAVVNNFPPPPRTLRPELAPELEQVIQTALAKEPEYRYQQAAQMLEALLPFVGEQSIGQLTLGKLSASSPEAVLRRPVSTPGKAHSQPGHVSSGTDLSWQARSEAATAPAKRSRTGLVVAAAVVVVLLLGGGLAVALTLGPANTEAVAAPPPPPVPEVQSAAAPTPAVQDLPPVPPTPPQVTLTLHGVPAGAAVFLDGAPEHGPVIRRPRAPGEHELRVEQEGHQPWSQRVTFERDETIAVALVPASAPPATPPDQVASPAPPRVPRPAPVRPRPDEPRPPGPRRPSVRFGTDFE